MNSLILAMLLVCLAFAQPGIWFELKRLYYKIKSKCEKE